MLLPTWTTVKYLFIFCSITLPGGDYSKARLHSCIIYFTFWPCGSKMMSKEPPFDSLFNHQKREILDFQTTLVKECKLKQKSPPKVLNIRTSCIIAPFSSCRLKLEVKQNISVPCAPKPCVFIYFSVVF